MADFGQTLVMFPGQGSQQLGMATQLIRDFPLTQPVFEEAEDVLGLPLRKVMADGPLELLTSTRYAQPAIFVVGLAYLAVLRAEIGLTSSYYAGHSLGEITALVAADKLTFSAALVLVTARALAMQQVFPVQHAAMAAVLKMSYAELQLSCDEVIETLGAAPPIHHGGRELAHYLDIAAINSTQQMVVAGSKLAMSCLKQLVEQRKNDQVSQVRMINLAVSAPFHSRYMQPAQAALTETFGAIKWQSSPAQVIANISGEIPSSYTSEHLLHQISRPVQWHRTLSTALQRGVECFIELGHSRVLQRMWAAEECFQTQAARLMGTADLRNFLSSWS